MVLTVIVFVHEMGHYLVARWNGIAIQTFSLGFGPELAGFNDRHGTRWRISAIPLGGYVRFVGDMNAASMPDPEAVQDLPAEEQARLFVNKNVWQRIAVVVAGPLANVLFTFLVLYALLLGYGRYTVPPVIGDVVAGGVAQQAGLEAGDRILSVDGFDVRGFEDFQRLISTAPDRPVTIVLERAGADRTIVLTPDVAVETDRFGNSQRIGRIGVTRTIAEGDITLYRPNPVEAVAMTGEEIRFIVDRTAAFLGDFFVGRGDVQPHIVALGIDADDILGRDAQELGPVRHPEFADPVARGAFPLAVAPACQRAPDRAVEPLGGDRLEDIVHRVEIERLDREAVVRGDEDDRRRLLEARQDTGQGEPVECRHLGSSCASPHWSGPAQTAGNLSDLAASRLCSPRKRD